MERFVFNKFRQFFLLLVGTFLIFGVVGPVPSAHAAGKVVIANGDWAPYQGKDLDGGGPASRIVQEAFRSQGWEVEFRYLPWARGLNLTQEGQLDATMLYSYNEDRGRSFIYSDPIISLDTVVFSRKADPVNWQKPEDLKGITLGAVLEYDYGFVSEANGYTLDRVASNEFNYRKLAAGRIAALLEERVVGLATIEREGLQGAITLNPKPVKSVPYHLIVSRSHPGAEKIMAVFNEGLAQLRAEGRLDALLQMAP
ncbi:transporter substrate-binding domain-containing protein [Desulfobotulus sp. H1]|uniref:Transporter substrate-binding domain-containing protein n=1 Tax=Desulfobotulus pelophilus TaxID=2823377 RepID=A0ABT3N8F0_9BACT|nr:transporter substrate-binding domain-containing protein [Desulfobotulus pelophilus]MCW7753466.1 transporter substrate-binding domain-containing protein [Desulfobotulus pelophilus]